MKTLLLPAAVLVCGLCTLAPSAEAAPASASAAKITADIAAGRALRKNGDLPGARTRFLAAFEAGGGAVAGHELAVVLNAEGDLNGAYDILMQVAQLTAKSGVELEAQRSAARLLAEVEPLIPMVEFDLSAIASQVTHFLIDDVELPREQWSELQPLNPGQHVTLARLQDGTGLEKTFSIAVTARARMTFTLPSANSASAAGKPAETTAAGAASNAAAGGGASSGKAESSSAPPVEGGLEVPSRACPPEAELDDDECVLQGYNYTWQVALVDAITTGTLAVGLATRLTIPAVGGAIGFPFGAPIVHWSHGRLGRGFASLGLHYVPAIGLLAYFGAAADGEGSPSEASQALLVIAAGGVGFGLDFLILGHTDETRTPVAARSAQLLPVVTVVPTRNGAAASLLLAF
ncbi:MAG: hypothetical protein ABI895_30355 [Deltaproteobacteria bacterium]